jgi:hypothetical protein
MFQDKHIHLAWGQIGVSEALSDDGATVASISEQLLAHIKGQSSSRASESPCFPVSADSKTSQCLLTTAAVPGSSSQSAEFGVLLRESLNNNEAWQKFLRKLQLPGAKLLQSPDNAPRGGGTVTGNLVWLFQSLIRTYSRTRELLKV